MSGYCLGSEALQDKIGEGILGEDIVEDQLQPSSFEPRLSGEGFVLDAEVNGLFRPESRRTIEESVNRLGADGKERIDITGGYELKQGFTYLLRLREQVRLADGEYVKGSPKSSLGRLFLHTRLLADYNLGFDEIHPQEGNVLDLYLLVQPLVFNVVIYPGLALNQLRWFTGVGSRLAPETVLDRHEKQPLLYKENGDVTEPADLTVSDSVYLHLDLQGYGQDEVAGLRAKSTPRPIDLSKKEAYDMHTYFEPIRSGDNNVEIRTQEHYLFGSKEVFDMPEDLSAEVYQHSATGISGPLHFAGFVDNGFTGNLVFEVRSDELSDMQIYDGMPISKVDFFKTAGAGKVYGDSIGSNYDGQRRIKVAKYFMNSV